MEKQKTMERILQAARIGDEQIDLVGKLLDLEQIDSNIHSIELYHNVVHHNGLLAEVYLLKNFSSMEEFQRYLNEKELKGTASRNTNEENRTYLLYNGEIFVEFQKPDYYPPKTNK
jgi:hypothetical protein